MATTQLTTINSAPASRLGLAGHYDAPEACVAAAADAGVNFFFFYNFKFTAVIAGLRPLLAERREEMIVATGSECRDVTEVRTYFDDIRRQLDIDTIDILFVEYVAPKDDLTALLGRGGVLSELVAWRDRGEIRYVGVSAHDRDICLELMKTGAVDVLMHRYNMAHRRSEERVLPAAVDAGIPVVAFTCTRWGTLMRGHQKWPRARPLPSAADCYSFALSHPAVQVALAAPATMVQLQSNLEVLQTSLPMDPDELAQWRAYGNLVYGEGLDDFEIRWP
ncbi:MAG: aldo/keto reductase [Lentisphaeria bacterium]|jgi:aryl-alcohol dehydrogenase-like predicted oxidoreductase|nr:aldo/keto reductase [Lentisphaeria bacterium]